MGRPGAWTTNVPFFAGSTADGVFTNMPAADTFLFSSARHICLVDLEGMSQVRLKVNKMGTAGNTGSKLILRYSKTYSQTVANYQNLGAGGTEVSVGVAVTNTFLQSAWIDIAEVAKDDVFLCIVGNGGNGTIDPAFGNIIASFI